MASDDLTAWRMDVSEKLGMLVQQTAALGRDVARQNGNVAKLWVEMDAVKAEARQHNEHCPLADDLRSLADEVRRGDQPPAKAAVEMIDHVRDRVAALELNASNAAAAQSARFGTIGWIWDNLGKHVVGYLIAGILLLLAAHNANIFSGRTSTSVTTETVKTSGK